MHHAWHPSFWPQTPPADAPTSATSSGTPPTPHDPIAPQGDPPPRRQVFAALLIATVLASWPSADDQRLQRPNDQQQKIAPLTLTYGRQPTPSGFLSAAELGQIIASWPPDSGPQLPYQPIRSLVSSAPPVSQPIPSAFLSPIELAQIVASWPPDSGPVLPWPDWQQRTSAVIAAQPPVSQPPVNPPLSAAELSQIASAWIPDPPTPPQANAPQPVRIAPLTLPTGTPPTPAAPLSATELAQIVASWTVTWDAQTAPKSASWNVPPILTSLPHTPAPTLLWSAWEPPWIAPPRPVTIAPLTLPQAKRRRSKRS